MEKSIVKRSMLYFGIVLTIAILSNGCAHSKANYTVIQPLKEGVVLKSYTNLELKAKSNEDVSITSSDMERIVNLIIAKVEAKDPNRFEEINTAVTNPSTVQYTLIFTKYEKGSSFARLMLAGLGQININADVLVEDKTRSEVLARYRIDKNFSLGGIYGGATKIEDVEEGFSEGVAAIILEEKEV